MNRYRLILVLISVIVFLMVVWEINQIDEDTCEVGKASKVINHVVSIIASEVTT